MNEILKNNPQFSTVLSNHMIPKDTISGLYENFYDSFIEDRAKLIFSKLEEMVISKQEYIESKFVTNIKKVSSHTGTIPIWGNYRRKKATAVYNIDTQEVLYNGNKYAVSTAADKAKIDLGAPETVSTNGWNFWKYADENGIDQSISDYRY